VFVRGKERKKKRKIESLLERERKKEREREKGRKKEKERERGAIIFLTEHAQQVRGGGLRGEKFTLCFSFLSLPLLR